MGHRLQEESIFINDYFIDIFDESLVPRFDEIKFHCHFPTRQSFFLRADTTDIMGYSSWRVCTAALNLLAYGTVSDILKESVRIGASTAMQRVKIFCEEIIELHKEEYLRSPNQENFEDERSRYDRFH